MIASQIDGLPASLLERLDETKRQAVAEAPRDKRLETLASALGISEADALVQLASASRLDIATNLEPDPDARGLLPARLVHDYQIMPIRYGTTRPDDDKPSPEELEHLPLHLATAWL